MFFNDIKRMYVEAGVSFGPQFCMERNFIPFGVLGVGCGEAGEILAEEEVEEEEVKFCCMPAEGGWGGGDNVAVDSFDIACCIVVLTAVVAML